MKRIVSVIVIALLSTILLARVPARDGHGDGRRRAKTR
jgi:hypothetical protein